MAIFVLYILPDGVESPCKGRKTQEYRKWFPVKQAPTDFWNKKPTIPMGEPPMPVPKPQPNKNSPLMAELGQRQRERKASRQPSERPPSVSSHADDVFDVKISSFWQKKI